MRTSTTFGGGGGSINRWGWGSVGGGVSAGGCWGCWRGAGGCWAGACWAGCWSAGATAASCAACARTSVDVHSKARQSKPVREIFTYASAIELAATVRRHATVAPLGPNRSTVGCSPILPQINGMPQEIRGAPVVAETAQV